LTAISMTESEVQIPFGSIDPRGAMKFCRLLELFQEMADVDASKYGFSVRQTMAHRETWVLRSYRVSLDRYPTAGDSSLRIRTWHEPYRKLFSLRSFELSDGSGGRLGFAATWWVLLDLERGRPIRLDRSGMDIKSQRVSEVQPEAVRVPEVKSPSLRQNWRIGWQDLDVNDHANHVAYFGWVLETVPFEVPYDMTPMLVEGEFLRPAARGIVSVATEERNCSGGRDFLHSMFDPESGTELARFRSFWKARPE
jgi:medium-chain acyl-[acyl-carrier-protein] hydrolase